MNWLAKSKGSGPPAEKNELSRQAAVLYGKTARPPLPITPPKIERPGHLGIGIDTSGSREQAWVISQRLTDAVFNAVPKGRLRVNLAAHGGSRVKVFTEFTDDPAPLQRIAKRLRCEAGSTRFVEILGKYLATGQAVTITYIGDTLEEDIGDVIAMAEKLQQIGSRIIVLHDHPYGERASFEAAARITGGFVLPFNKDSIRELKSLFGAIGVLASDPSGGTALLESQRDTLPGARLLLQYLGK
jgi:hypothetical protein